LSVGKRRQQIGPLGIAVLGAILGMVYNTLVDFSNWVWLYPHSLYILPLTFIHFSNHGRHRAVMITLPSAF
jgi:hypothetical protein